MKLKLRGGVVTTFFFSLCLIGCQDEESEPAVEVAKAKKLFAEEYWSYNENKQTYEASHEMIYNYNADKLSSIDVQDYNPNTGEFDATSVYRLYEFIYNDDERLEKRIEYAGDFKWIQEYEYVDSTTTKVKLYEIIGNGRSPENTYLFEKKGTEIRVNYFDPNNIKYWEIECELSSDGNISRTVKAPYSSVGKISYKYDNAPNPKYFPEIIGHPFTEEFYSKNNVIEVESENYIKTTAVIEYDTDGYPVKITKPTSMRIFSYY